MANYYKRQRMARRHIINELYARHQRHFSFASQTDMATMRKAVTVKSKIP